MFVDEELARDPFNKESVMGWGVVRCYPWHLVGIYSSEEKARWVSEQLGIDYEVVYGSHVLGSHNFIWGIDY